MLRIDTHHHVIPPNYRKVLARSSLLEAGGRALPEWSAEASLQAMADLEVGTAILSVSTPGTAFLPNPADAAALARDLNDYIADVVATQPDRLRRNPFRSHRCNASATPSAARCYAASPG